MGSVGPKLVPCLDQDKLCISDVEKVGVDTDSHAAMIVLGVRAFDVDVLPLAPVALRNRAGIADLCRRAAHMARFWRRMTRHRFRGLVKHVIRQVRDRCFSALSLNVWHMLTN